MTFSSGFSTTFLLKSTYILNQEILYQSLNRYPCSFSSRLITVDIRYLLFSVLLHKRMSLCCEIHIKTIKFLLLNNCLFSHTISPTTFTPRLISNISVSHISISKFANWLFLSTFRTYTRRFTSVITDCLNNSFFYYFYFFRTYKNLTFHTLVIK